VYADAAPDMSMAVHAKQILKLRIHYLFISIINIHIIGNYFPRVQPSDQSQNLQPRCRALDRASAKSFASSP